MWLTALLLRPTAATAAPVRGSAASAPAVARSPEPVEPDAVEASLVARLTHLVEVERVHLDPGMTLELFVGRMGASERTVRHLINHRLGYDHFRTFLNVQRVEEARRRLRDPARDGEKMIAVAADSGFASLASFNRVFRDIERCTPGEYRRSRGRSVVRKGAAEPPPSASEEPCAGF